MRCATGPRCGCSASNGRALVCEAVIAGRGQDAGTANLGVFLELPRAPEALLEAQTLVGD